MATMISEVYEALREAGVSKEKKQEERPDPSLYKKGNIDKNFDVSFSKFKPNLGTKR